MSSHVTTHVLDAAQGRPAAGIAVDLQRRDGDDWTHVAAGTTNSDGRIGELGPQRLPSGTYRVNFAVADYFEAQQVRAFYPEVTVTFLVDENEAHYHVPVLLSPFAYSTYRGS